MSIIRSKGAPCTVAVTLAPWAAETEQCGYNRGTVRIQGGRNQREGRVEICNDGWWGQLCENGWDNNDAKVVCRQLSLLSADTGKLLLVVSVFLA